jgi:CTP:molybdopterin cytidylyltransferase MocA
MNPVAAVVLAAGASSRLGQPKQLVRLAGETLLERAVRVAGKAGCGPVVVVLGASAEKIQAECSLGDARIVVNKDWAEGMGSSIRAGVGALEGVKGCVVMTCDMPTVTAGHLRRLMGSNSVTASAYAGRRGVPAYFPSAVFSNLMELRGDSGAKGLLQEAACVDLVNGELDVDTVGDLNEATGRFG